MSTKLQTGNFRVQIFRILAPAMEKLRRESCINIIVENFRTSNFRIPAGHPKIFEHRKFPDLRYEPARAYRWLMRIVPVASYPMFILVLKLTYMHLCATPLPLHRFN